ncbi:uncharacterized protein METZ01_LOCUS183934 [marine metagenome]|uniref:Uncharacterized protein n=1 Tax=marine metagenome TaxID=408172 RepID=A0A382CY22_9ZZZZ
MEFFIIIILVVIAYYIFFRKKPQAFNNSKELYDEAFDLTMKQEKVVAHSKLFDQTDMFLDIVHEGFSQKWTESTYEEEKKAGQEIKELKIQFETVKKLKFVGKETKDILPLDTETFETINDINQKCRKIYDDHLKRFYEKSFDDEWTPKAYSLN